MPKYLHKAPSSTGMSPAVFPVCPFTANLKCSPLYVVFKIHTGIDRIACFAAVHIQICRGFFNHIVALNCFSEGIYGTLLYSFIGAAYALLLVYIVSFGKIAARYAVWKSTAPSKSNGSMDSIRSSSIFSEPSTGIFSKDMLPERIILNVSVSV